jgi:hypothetical protein
MRDGNWFRQGRGRSKGGKARGGKAKRRRPTLTARDRGRLSFESLEDRRMLAVFLVTNTFADGVGSLRWAVDGANANAGGDTIVFAEYAFENGFSNVIRLEGELNITDAVSILGPGAQALTVRQTDADTRVFNVGANSQISGMTITGGNGVADGGGVQNSANLTMTEVIVENNSATRGGGIANTGTLTLQRSLIANNRAEQGGGIFTQASLNTGASILNSTITGNRASGGSAYEGKSYGGGVFNRDGRLTITASTIVENNATDEGKGVASWGNPLPEEEGGDPPAPTVGTTISRSIVFNNSELEPSDVDRVGLSDDDPPLELLASNNTGGYNIIGSGNATRSGPDLAFSTGLMGDQVGVDPLLLPLDDYGGAVPVFMPDFTDPLKLSPAIDAGPSFIVGFEARGRHFARTFDFTAYQAAGGGDPLDFRDPFTAIVDIGAAEVQAGNFLVDTLYDEDDGSYSGVYVLEYEAGEPDFTIGGYTTLGDFSLREAVGFSDRNPLTDYVRFSDTLISADILDREDVTPSAPPTIYLTLGQMSIVLPEFGVGQLPYLQDLYIEGPTEFVLEVDSTGNDPQTPDLDDGLGDRIFEVNDGSSASLTNVFISNLTLMGGDQVGRGGAILNRENLTLKHMTFKENFATDDGGAIAHLSGSLVVEESTFKNNRAGDDGGAVLIDTIGVGPQTESSFVNSTFSANVAGDKGAGIYNKNSQALVSFSTITLNDANSLRGSGIANEGANSLTTLWASIVSGNESNDVEYVTTPPGATLSSFVSLGHNLVGNGNARLAFNQTGDRNNIFDPRLAPLANTGGLIETHRPIYDVNPALSSPVIDMGPDAAGPLPLALPLFDQRGEGFVTDGFARVVGARADIGAYEVQRMVLYVSTLNDENDGNLGDGELSLREAIELSNKNPTLPGSLPDEIQFDPVLVAFLPLVTDATLYLSPLGLMTGTPADLRITDSLKIVGPGSDLLAISGAELAPRLSFFPEFSFAGARMFTINDGNSANLLNVEISGFTFRDAYAPAAGGVMWSSENLSLDEVVFINNYTSDPDETLAFLPPVDQQDLHGGALYQQQGTLDVTNALFTGNHTSDVLAHGAAIYVSDGALNTEFVTIAGNSVLGTGNGGAVALKNSTYTSHGDTISGNSTQGGVGDGGGIYGDASVVELRESTVSGNYTLGANAEGGGISGRNSTINLLDSVVSLNSTAGSQSHGGGIFANGGTTTLTRSIVSQNNVNGQQAAGGGIAMIGGAVTLDLATVDRNRATNIGGNGGGIWNTGGILTVKNSSLWNNQAQHSQAYGGGVYSDDALINGLPTAHSTLIVNSTVSGNSAGFRGGGVFNADGVTEIRHSTITNNSTPFMNAGNGVASLATTATTTRLYSSIVAGNVGAAAGTGSDIDFVDGAFFNSFQSLGYNLVGTGNSLAKFTAALNDQKSITNPLLGPLANNGGLTRTHALLAGSLAIDKGNPAAVAGVGGVPAHDQRGPGFTRVYNGDNLGTARIDVGAFELQGPGFAGDFSGDDIVDGTDFLVWQRNVATPNPVKSNGDLDNDHDIDGVDLAGWGASFGAGAEDVAAVAAATIGESAGGELFASEASVAAADFSDDLTTPATTAVVSTAVADVVEDAPAPPAQTVSASFVGLGRPGAHAADGALAGFAKQADRQVAAVIAALSLEKPHWAVAAKSGDKRLSLLDDAEASPDGESAEDAVFADWEAAFSA